MWTALCGARPQAREKGCGEGPRCSVGPGPRGVVGGRVHPARGGGQHLSESLDDKVQGQLATSWSWLEVALLKAARDPQSLFSCPPPKGTFALTGVGTIAAGAKGSISVTQPRGAVLTCQPSGPRCLSAQPALLTAAALAIQS